RKTRLTPNGRGVNSRTWRIDWRTSSRLLQVRASMPRPPALETAATRAGVAPRPTGAWTRGTSLFSNRVSEVSNRGMRPPVQTELRTIIGRELEAARGWRIGHYGIYYLRALLRRCPEGFLSKDTRRSNPLQPLSQDG